MAGEALTSAFVLSTASLMIGPTNKLFELLPATHGLGLVKNVKVTADVSYTELKQGVKQNIVYSVQTGNDVKIAGEVYEYSGKNLTYGLGLDGSTVVSQTDMTLKTAITTGGTAVVATVAVDPTIVAGDWVVVQDQAGLQDKVFVGRVASATYTGGSTQVAVTLDALTPMPSTMTFPIGARVIKANRAPIGAQLSQPFFGCKITGVLPQGGMPITLLFPKVRVTKGFDLQFVTDNFASLPFELTPYQLTTTDDNYAIYAGRLGDVHSGF